MPTVTFVVGLLLVALGVGAYFFWSHAGDQTTKAKIPGFEVEVQNAALGLVVLGIVLIGLALSYSGRPGDAPAQSPRPPEVTTTDPTQPSTVSQSPAPIAPAAPSAEPQQPSAPRRYGKVSLNKLTNLHHYLAEAAFAIDAWESDLSSSSVQPIRDTLEYIGSNIDRIRRDLD